MEPTWSVMFYYFYIFIENI